MHGARMARTVWGSFHPPIGPPQNSSTQQHWNPKTSNHMSFLQSSVEPEAVECSSIMNHYLPIHLILYV